MPPDATLRRLTPDDVGAYRHLRLAALRTNPDAFGSTFDAEAARSDAEHAERLAPSVVIGAYVDGQVVGMLGCKRHDGARELHKAFLWGFYVDPAHRRSGLATALLASIIDAAPSGVEQLLLAVVATNRSAITLYERSGFRAYGTEPRSLKTDGAYTDETLMVLFLTGRTSP